MSSQSVVDQIVARDMTRCVYFNGMMNDACKAGIRYHDLVGSEIGWGLRLPCIKLERSTDTVPCSRLLLPTAEEAKAKAEEIVAAATERMEAIARGECPICERKVEMRQVGRCVYGDCGHRMYQVKLKRGGVR